MTDHSLVVRGAWDHSFSHAHGDDTDPEWRKPRLRWPAQRGRAAGLGLDTSKIAVERNEEIVSRSRYAQTWLGSGDSLEIVHFIGGG